MNEEHKNPEDTNATPGDSGMNMAESQMQAQPESTPETSAMSGDDVSDHKVLAIVGYILPFLFFLPLVSEEGKKSEFARFHANQHLILLITLVGVYVLHNIFYMLFMMGGFFIIQLVNLALLILVIIGIINAAQGKKKELPIIGGFDLLK